MSNDNKVRDLFAQLPPNELPVGIYLISKDGRFLECNRRAREILHLPAEDPLDATFADLLPDDDAKEDFSHVLSETEVEGACFHTYPMRLVSGGHTIFVQNGTRALVDSETRATVGFIGCLTDVTEQESYRRLLEHLPVGAYRMNAENRFTYVNDAFMNIFGYESKQNVPGREEEELYADPDDLAVLEERIDEEGFVLGHIEEQVKKSGETFFASVSAVRIFGPDGESAGREGTVVDVTREELNRRTLNDLPLGLFDVHLEDGRDIIRWCNPYFAGIYGYGSVDEAVGTDIRELFASTGDYDAFMENLKARDSRGLPLVGHTVKVKNRQGREFIVETNSRLLKDRAGKIVGRFGAQRDITEEHALRIRINELQMDIGQVLHSYSQFLMAAKLTVGAAIPLVGLIPLEGGKSLSQDDIGATSDALTARLVESVDRLIGEVEPDWQERGLRPSDWNELNQLPGRLQAVDIPIVEHRPEALRFAARKTVDLSTRILRHKTPRELVKVIVDQARILEQITSFPALDQLQDDIIAMEHQVRGLREHVSTGARPEEPVEVFRIGEVVRQAQENLAEFYRNRGVEIKVEGRSEAHGVRVRANRRDVLRALINLLHNAIKYSRWSVEKESPFVTIDVFTEEDRICVAFSNFGIPIPRDEIEDGLVFRLGYRGRLSGERGRVGTGIGLADVYNVARYHGGDITVESHPATDGHPEDDYSVPFLTTVRFTLPLIPDDGENEHE